MLKDKVVVVTGAGSGIGEGASLELAKEGASLVLADINSDSGKEVLRKVEEIGAKAIFVKADVNIESDIVNLVNTAVTEFGRIDCAFNNAGVEGGLAEVENITTEQFDFTISTNLRSIFLCMKYQIAAMKKTGGGSIVNMASVMGMVGSPRIAPYCASKSGIIGLTRTAALECAEKGIRVNSVCPGAVKTRMVAEVMENTPEVLSDVINAVPMKRLATTAEVGQAVVWLCSDRSSFVTGIQLPVDGAYTAQ